MTIEYFDTLPHELTEDERQQFLETTKAVNERRRKVYYFSYGQVPGEAESGGVSEKTESVSYGVAEPRHCLSVLDPERIWFDERIPSVLQEAIIRYAGIDADKARKSTQRILNAMRAHDERSVEEEMSRYTKEAADNIISETERSIIPTPTTMREEELVEWIRKKNVVFYSGAGISVGGGSNEYERTIQSFRS